MKIIYIHHGNRQGENDCLSPLGVRDCELVAELLQDAPLKNNINAIYVGRSQRCLHTAEIINQNLKLDIIQESRLNEFDSANQTWQQFQENLMLYIEQMIALYNNNDVIICVTSGVNIAGFISKVYGLKSSEQTPFIGVPSCSPLVFDFDKEKHSGLYLQEPTELDQEKAMDFIAECKNNNSIMNGTGGLDKAEDYGLWLEKIRRNKDEQTVENGKVPASEFFVFRKTDNKLVGMVNVRHRLNDRLLLDGGHIGDMVRPSERNKGYATLQIALALNKCREMGIKKVLVTCNKNNIASIRTIEKNYGILENEITLDGKTYLRYWIDIK